jgi:hypothetical protein
MAPRFLADTTEMQAVAADRPRAATQQRADRRVRTGLLQYYSNVDVFTTGRYRWPAPGATAVLPPQSAH